MIRRITILFLLIPMMILGQDIRKDWSIVNDSTSFLSMEQNNYFLKLPTDSIPQSGTFIEKNDLLLFLPKDSLATAIPFYIVEKTDTLLLLSANNQLYRFQSEVNTEIESLAPSLPQKQLIASQGFTFESFWRGALGMFVLLVIAYICSSNRSKIRWKTVTVGLLLQVLLAFGVLRVPAVQNVFEAIGNVFIHILDFTKAGSEFLLGSLLDTSTYGFIFIFQILPTIIFFSALTSVLFYLGVIQVIVRILAWGLAKFMGISGAESLSVAGNIFLGQTEAPLMIKAYLEKMNRSEILLVMVGGMATVAGGVLAAYIGFLGGDDPELRLVFAKHLLAASVMAAPGAVVISKMLYPQEGTISTQTKISADKVGANLLDAIANGTTEGLKLAANVGAMLLVFVAFIAMLNHFLGWIGDVVPANNTIATWLIGKIPEQADVQTLNHLIATTSPYSSLSLETLLGLLFSPLMWIIGVATEDMMLMGQLLGIKLAASEFIGYVQLAELKNVANAIHLTYDKSVIMATYMLCGFANFASIGIQIGGIGSLAPGQRKNLSEFGMKAVLGGSLASLLSATIAGMIIG